MKNKDREKKLNEIRALQRDLETLRSLQRRHRELVALQKELNELKTMINDYSDIFDQTKLEIVKNDGEQ